MVSVIDDPRIKEKCQIFTPVDIVAKMLDLSGYSNDVVGKTILENSCGNGEFLAEITERYIRDAISSGISLEGICKGLERDIVAYEIDKELISVCKNRLNSITLRYNISDIQWNIHCGSFLSKEVTGKYDYIIGNPPYIAYPDLPENERKELKSIFSTCKKGKFDYSYAFIEKSFDMLKTGGKLVYIIPSNIFKNVFAEELRKLIKGDLTTVIDFPQDKVFSGVLVSPAIIVVEKSIGSDHLSYTKVLGGKETANLISKEKLVGKWVFDALNTEGRRVGKHFKVSNSIATLCNRVFVLKSGYFESNFYCIGEDKIESAILKKTTGPKSKRSKKEKEEYLIFPYRYDQNGILVHYTEEEMREYFPSAMQYLDNHRAELDARDTDESAAWFEYGRSQALQNPPQKMIIISSVISEDTKAYLLKGGEIPYAGLYITPTGKITLEYLLKKLNSKSFKEYISCVGVSVSGSSKRITTKDIENFAF